MTEHEISSLAKHLAISRRVGTVLVVFGLLDIAAMIVCIINDISYSSSFNIFAVIAGIFLLRSSLRAASFTRRAAAFLSAAFASVVVILPFMQPIDLTLTQFRLQPWSALSAGIILILLLGLLQWVSKELGRAEVNQAFAAAGRKPPGVRVPAILGAGILIVPAIIISFVMPGGETAAHAKQLAEQEVGTGYKFHVKSLNVQFSGQGKRTSANVVGWNDKEIKDVKVQWSE